MGGHILNSDLDSWLDEEDMNRVGKVIEGKLPLDFASLEEIEEYERLVVAFYQERNYH